MIDLIDAEIRKRLSTASLAELMRMQADLSTPKPAGKLVWADADVPGRFTWQEAKEEAICYGKYFSDGWRLPTITELLTLVDYERTNPASALPGIKADWYWTSTPRAASPGGCAWYVNFGSGYTGWNDHGALGLVRAVRTEGGG